MNLKFILFYAIIFLGESNPQILTMFANKYPQNKINDREKDVIILLIY